MTTKRSLAWGVLLALAIAGPAAAQTAPDVGFSSVPFNFAPPGARSLAMGATFIGIADDATASASNPAGLVILTRPEISAHLRYTKFEEQQTESELAGSFALESTKWSPSFVSIVIPAGQVHLSAYYQQVANFDTGNAAVGSIDLGGGFVVPVTAFSGISTKVEDIGASLAFKLGEQLAVGATVAYRKMALRPFLNSNQLFGFEELADTVEVDADDSQVVFNAGLLVNPNGKFSLGLVYKKGGKFKFPYTIDSAIFGFAACPGTSQPSGILDPAPCTEATVQIPDVFGGGLALRPSASFLVAADVTFVKYSQLGTTELRLLPFDLFPPATDFAAAPEFDDVVEFHAGAEYTFIGDTPVSLRAGVYNRPNFNKGGTTDAGATFFTFGGGLVFGGNFQLDLAASLSDQVKEGLASVVVRF
jgi:long-subunit fatty acid transport protein